MKGNLTNEKTCLFVILDIAAVEEAYFSYIINIVLNTCLAPPTVILNIVVLASIWRSSSLHTPSNIFICSLALSDFFIGLITLPFYVAYKISEINNKFDEYCAMGIQVVALYSVYFLAGVSFATLTAMSIDRYLALHLGMRYRAVVTTSRVTKVLVGLWIFAAFLGSLQFFLSSQTFFRVVTGVMVCFLGIMTVAYIKAFKALKHHQAQLAKSQSSNSFSVAKYRRTLYVVLYMIGLILMCYLPHLCVFIAIAIKGLTGATRAAKKHRQSTCDGQFVLESAPLLLENQRNPSRLS